MGCRLLCGTHLNAVLWVLCVELFGKSKSGWELFSYIAIEAKTYTEILLNVVACGCWGNGEHIYSRPQ